MYGIVHKLRHKWMKKKISKKLLKLGLKIKIDLKIRNFFIFLRNLIYDEPSQTFQSTFQTNSIASLSSTFYDF